MRCAIIAMLAAAAVSGQVKLPNYTRDVLPNGVVVYLMPKPGLPLVDFRILVRGGAESEPAGLAGVASLTAELLRRGTADRTPDQFSEQLDFLGGTFNARADEQSTEITAEFLKKDFDDGLDAGFSRSAASRVSRRRGKEADRTARGLYPRSQRQPADGDRLVLPAFLLRACAPIRAHC